MFQIITMWNLVKPDEEIGKGIENIELRGYNPETFLTGEFARRIKAKLDLDLQRQNREITEAEYKDEIKSTGAVNPLSVSNIADKCCPTRRDLYFTKGINKPNIDIEQKTWGRKAGYVVEDYVEHIFKSETNNPESAYTSLIAEGNNLHKKFISDKKDSLEALSSLEGSYGAGEGDTDWLLTLLSNNGKAILGNKMLHSLLKENGGLDTTNIKIKEEIRPNEIQQIGINSPAKPDFIIPEFGIVGDIKTGIEFKPYFQLTCTGYALVYENTKGKDYNIDWGIIYFIPTKNPSAYVRPLTFAQIYIFPIDDSVRQWFFDIRDEAYNIISRSNHPDFPDTNKRDQCLYCKFKEYCKSKNLELKEYE